MNKSDYPKADVTVESGKSIPVNFLQEVKASLDLLTVACELYPDLKAHGSKVYQGGHGRIHDSKNGQCLTVWPGTHSWKCFNCGQGGDVIDLIGVSIFGTSYSRHGSEFVAALNEAARRTGLSQEFLTPEQKVELAERERLYSLLKDAARWYNAQFEKYPEIYQHLQTNYGFKEEFIQKKAIGFAPPWPSSFSFDPDKGFTEINLYTSKEPLVDHLLSLGYTQKEIMASSLVSKGCYSIYHGRIMIPYWQNGKVVYFTARATRHTPYNVYETHSSGELKKYLKLKVRDEKNKQISELIRNDVLFGIDTLKIARQKGYLLITEGAPDQLAAEQAGEPCISPLTTTFSLAQQQQLLKAVKSIKGLKVFICNDNEENQAGEKGAMATALFLEKQGIKTYLIKLPPSAEKYKVDLCEFLRDSTSTSAALAELYSAALKLPDYCLQHQPLPSPEEPNDVKAAFINKVADLALNVCHYDPLNLSALQEKLASTLKVSKSLIKTMFRQVLGQTGTGSGNSTSHANERGQKQPGLSGNENGAEQGETERKSQATMLVELAGDLELFHNGEGKAFASFHREDHTETWPLRSRSFKLIIKERFYRQYGQAFSAPALEDALSLLEARALLGPQHQIYNRIAREGDSIYLDLSNGNWEVVKIGPTGWEILQNSPVRFRRNSGMLPMVSLCHGGRLDRFRQFVNVTNQDWKLLAAWLVTAFNPQCQYPVLTMSGEQGSAKSTASRFIRRLVDPSLTLLRAAPRDARDFWIGAQNSWVVAYDNLSGIPAWLSDTLCRVSTGGGNVTRLLYSDDEEVFFDARRPVLLNGIDAVATRGDLLERSLVLNLPAIDEKDRKSERQLTHDFEAALPEILGGLLDAVSLGLSRIESVQLNRLPKMADFTLWSVAAEPAFGGPSGTISFLEAYTRQREDSHVLALEASPLAQTFLGWYASFKENYPLEKGCWLGNANTLLRELEQSLPETEQKLVVRQLTWPKNARSLSVQLHRLAPNLRAMGLDLTFHVYQGEIKRGIQIQPVYLTGKTASDIIGTSSSNGTQNYHPGTQTFDNSTQVNDAGTQTGATASIGEEETEICVPQQRNECEAKSTGIDLTRTGKTQSTQILTKESREFVENKEAEIETLQNKKTSGICVPFVPGKYSQLVAAMPTSLPFLPFTEETSSLPFGPDGEFDLELALESDLEEKYSNDTGKELEIKQVQPLKAEKEEKLRQNNFSLERLTEAIEEASGDYQALLNLKREIDLADNLSFQEKYQLGSRLKVLVNGLLFPFSSKE